MDRTPHLISGSLPLPPALSVGPLGASFPCGAGAGEQRGQDYVHLASAGRRALHPTSYDGTTLAEVLDGVAADYPLLKGYVLDDQGRLRKHITIFINGTMQPRDSALDIPLTRASTVYVLQALSGG